MWSKTLTRTVAVERGRPVSPEVRWCIAESVWRFAADNGLVVESFREAEPRRVEDVPKRSAGVLGRRREDMDWHVFEAVVRRA